MKPTIAILNRTTALDDSLFPPVVAALQKQVSGDFAPLWAKDATLVFVGKTEAPPQGAWQQIVADTVPVAGALGYHDFTAQGLPIGKTGVVTTKKSGGHWTVTLSHELLEMLGDPDIIRTVFIQQAAMRSLIVAYEACDPVEAEQFGYDIDGVRVSDFVTEEWFEPSRSGVAFSFRGNVKRPMQLAPGGYISVYRPLGGRWSQLVARTDAVYGHGNDVVRMAMRHEDDNAHVHASSYGDLPHVGSRRERRGRARVEWLWSAE